jgi:hypothetical protein
VQAYLFHGGSSGGAAAAGGDASAAAGKLTYGVPVQRWDTVDDEASKQAAALAKCCACRHHCPALQLCMAAVGSNERRLTGAWHAFTRWSAMC